MLDLQTVYNRICDNISVGQLDFNDTQILSELVKNEKDDVKKQIADSFLKKIGKGEVFDIWLYSFALKLYPDPMVLKQLIMYIKISASLNYKNKYFLFQQINSMIFKNPIYNTEDIVQFAWSLLDSILKECKKALNLNLCEIPVYERNKGISVVLVEQFLSVEHGPTKTALDRCHVLKKQFCQNVMLINTAELLTPANCMYFEDIDIANYIEQLSTQNSVSWQGEQFMYYQCPNNMPSDEGLLDLVQFITDLKPASIVLVGGTSLVAGLLNELVPVITVGTIQSGLAMTLSKYQIIDQNMLDKGYRMLENMGKDSEHVIPGKFTFSLKPQVNHITRASIGIEENKFAIALVGGRLTNELSDDFLQMLEDCIQEDMVVGVIGMCSDFDKKIANHNKLKNKMINIGPVNDILSVIEHFDLYVNPIRRGGGTSSVEAMFKGLPVVTVNYGDVAGIVGPEFCCENYDEMKKLILKYKDNEDFYKEKSEHSYELSKIYLDSSGEFSRIMCEYYNKQGFKVDLNTK